jgi:uncharacterized protein YndB with AHSA1/START domain
MPDPTWTVTIDAPPEKVWPWVADLAKHREWSPKPYRMEWLSGDPNAVGSRFRSHGWLPQDKDHEMEGTITANEPRSRYELVATDASGDWMNRYELAPHGSGTVVTKTMVGPSPTGAGKVAFPVIFAVLVRPGVQKGMNQLKTTVERAG